MRLAVAAKVPSPLWALAVILPVAVVAVAAQARSAAIAALAICAIAFLIVTLRDAGDILFVIPLLVPLVTIEVGFGSPRYTLASDKIVLAVAAGAWLASGAASGLPAVIRRHVVLRWLGGLWLAIGLGALLHGFVLRQIWVLAKEVMVITVFLLALDRLRTAQARERALRYVLWGSALVSALTVAQYVAHRLVGWSVPLFFKSGTILDEFIPSSMYSTIGHSNFLGGYLMLTLPLAALAVLAGRLERPPVLWAILAVQIGAVVAARSIGSTVALALALTAGALMLWPRLGVRARWLLIGGGVAAAAATAVFLSWSPQSLMDRLEVYRVGARMFAERPVIGFSAGGFETGYELYHTEVFGRASRFGPQSAHNSFLAVLVDFGLPALVCFAMALGSLVAATGRVIRAEMSRGSIPLALGPWLGILGFTINALAENLFTVSKTAVLFWLLAALLILETRADGAGEPATEGART